MRVEHIGDATLYCGDCLDVLPTLDADSVDSIVCDPPYGLSFMGRAWDHSVPSLDVWREVLRVLKPGGHLLAFAGTRTQHRMAVAIEDAGFEIRDMIAWVFGSGFPKSLNVSKVIDKAAGAEREVVGPKVYAGGHVQNHGGGKQGYHEWGGQGIHMEDAPTTEAARQWDGWGTALKPALEPITVARKPLTGTVAANVLQHGTGAINVDGCRVGTEEDTRRNARGGDNGLNGESTFKIRERRADEKPMPIGRWPANLIHDGGDEVVRLFPVTKNGGQNYKGGNRKSMFGNAEVVNPTSFAGDSGSAARFFYQAKCSKRDRNEGLPEGTTSTHPTVKPTDLMRYLVRLVTPPGGTVFDPFMGSGSTGKACAYEEFRFIGIELASEYMEIAKARIAYAQAQPKQGELSLDCQGPT